MITVLEKQFKLFLTYFSMSQPMEECENCKKMFPQSKIPTHFGYCRRNIKKCATCGEHYDINFQEEHEEEFHQKSKCQFCQNQFPAADVKKHENSCTKRTKFCQYCELNVPVSQYPIHLKACESRTKQCEKCRKPIANKEYLVHLVSCPGFVEEKPEQIPKDYRQYVNNNRERVQQPARKEPHLDYYSGNIGSKQPPTYSYKQYIKTETQKNEMKKGREEPIQDYYSKNRGGQGISSTTQPRKAYPIRRQPEKKQAYGAERVPNGYEISRTTQNTNVVQSRVPQNNHIGVKPASRGSIERNSNKQIPSSNQVPKYGVRAPQKYEQPARDSNKYSLRNDMAINGARRQEPKLVSRQDIKPEQPKYPISNQRATRPQNYQNPREPIIHNPSRNPPPRNPVPVYDPTEDFDPQEFDFDDHPNPPNNDNFGELNEAEMEEQKMIWESMQSKSSKPTHKKPSNLPIQLQGADMNESFYRDLVDVEKQKQIYEDLQKKNRRR